MFSATIIFAKLMKPYVYFFFLIFMFSSCQSGDKLEVVDSKPDWVIEENKMIDIIMDLRVVEAAVYINSNQAPRNKTKDWEFVMKKHQVVDSVFIKSHEYYAGYPQVLSGMYEHVIDRLSEMQAENYENQ
jgi:hypothetical protein